MFMIIFFVSAIFLGATSFFNDEF